MGCALSEAVYVGVATILFGLVIGWLLVKTGMVDEVPTDCLKITSQVCLFLFLTGFSMHLFFEYVGANRWYCVNGVACRKLRAEKN